MTSRYVQIAAHQDLSLSAVIRGERSLSSTMRHFLDSSTAKLLQHTPAPPVAAQRAVSKVSALAGINARKQLVEQQKQQPPAPELEPAAPAGSPPPHRSRHVHASVLNCSSYGTCNSAQVPGLTFLNGSFRLRLKLSS